MTGSGLVGKMKHGKQLLIIFYRNPELGKVKTRLAATLGEEKALAIYLSMASHTRTIADQVTTDKVIYYTDFIDWEDNWPNEKFGKKLQHGSDLGDKMASAFAAGFKDGFKRICIVGTDCFELTAEIITQAFHELEQTEVVIGPAKDGGYYLLGMTRLIAPLFKNKKWSTDTVYSDTVKDLNEIGQNFFQLQPLTDVDEEKDLPAKVKILL